MSLRNFNRMRASHFATGSIVIAEPIVNPYTYDAIPLPKAPDAMTYPGFQEYRAKQAKLNKPEDDDPAQVAALRAELMKTVDATNSPNWGQIVESERTRNYFAQMAVIFRANISRDNLLEPTTLNYLLKWIERILEHIRTPDNMCDSRSTFVLDAMALNSDSSFFERVAMKLASTELEIAESKRKERQLDVEDSLRREQIIDKELELARLKNGQDGTSRKRHRSNDEPVSDKFSAYPLANSLTPSAQAFDVQPIYDGNQT